jgi:hypothetical protein
MLDYEFLYFLAFVAFATVVVGNTTADQGLYIQGNRLPLIPFGHMFQGSSPGNIRVQQVPCFHNLGRTARRINIFETSSKPQFFYFDIFSYPKIGYTKKRSCLVYKIVGLRFYG